MEAPVFFYFARTTWDVEDIGLVRGVRRFDYCEHRQCPRRWYIYFNASGEAASFSYCQGFECADQPDELDDCCYTVLEEISVQLWHLLRGWWYHS
jgi:hypothetical protein